VEVEVEEVVGKDRRRERVYLAVGGAVGLDDPAGLVAERLEHLVVVAVLGQLVPAVRAEAREDLGGDRAAPPLPPLVVLALPPRGHPAGAPHAQRPSSASAAAAAARHASPRAEPREVAPLAEEGEGGGLEERGASSEKRASGGGEKA
jgi:hypothetical protein